MHKRFTALFLLFVILVLSGCGASSAITETGAPLSTVASFGKTPARYKGAVLEKELLKNATVVSDGYLLQSGTGVEKYDFEGNLLWEKIYSFISQSDYIELNLLPAKDGSFFIFYSPSSSGFRFMPSVLARCGSDGTLLWQEQYHRGGYQSPYVFLTENGNILVADDSAKGDIHLSLFDKNGKLQKDKEYGGSDYEGIADAGYGRDTGLTLLIDTQSQDGTFSASTNGLNVTVLFSVDEKLNIRWQKPLSQLWDYYLQTTDETIFILNADSDLTLYDSDGNTVGSHEFGRETFCEFAGNSKYGLAIETNNGLSFYRDGAVALSIDTAGSYIENIVDTDFGFIVVSVNNTGELPAPALVSSIWYSTELVYSGYNGKGRLLWRSAVDNTPEFMKNYKDLETGETQWN